MIRSQYVPLFPFAERSWPWVLGVLFCVFTASLNAHYLNMTRSSLYLDTANQTGRIDLLVDFTKQIGSPIRYHDLTVKAPDLVVGAKQGLSNALTEGLYIEVDGQLIALELESFTFPDLPLRKFTEQWAAPMSKLTYRFDLPPSARQLRVRTDSFLKIEFPLVLSIGSDQDERKILTRWLEPGQASPVYSLAATVASMPEDESLEPESGEEDSFFLLILRYVQLGFEHIIPKGFDHILFILGLFFLSHRWRPLLAQASVFTFAHTLTLLFSSLDWIVYSPQIVEPLIALSIVYVGFENVFVKQLQKGRLLIVFIFGLIHGMGFANMFSEIDLAMAEFFVALVCFNFGVELGQIAVLCLAWLAMCSFFSRPYYRRVFQIPASILIAVVASFWFFERVGLFYWLSR
ncbi:MAG: HupE/UreJ family protein [Verrucomicrobiota bacterium]